MKRFVLVLAGVSVIVVSGWVLVASTSGSAPQSCKNGMRWCSATKTCIRPQQKCVGRVTSSKAAMSSQKSKVMPGSDRDSHGCIPSAGFTWCEAKRKCLRIWEEACPQPTLAKSPTCVNVGTKSEGWRLTNGTIKYATCGKCAARCLHAGTKSEGWYDTCTSRLIEWAECAE